MTPKAGFIRGQTDNSNFIKIKTICSAKELVKRMKPQATDREETFANHIHAKELVSIIHKEPSPLHNKCYMMMIVERQMIHMIDRQAYR